MRKQKENNRGGDIKSEREIPRHDSKVTMSTVGLHFMHF